LIWLPSDPWFWILIIAIVLFHIYILKRIIEAKDEDLVLFRQQVAPRERLSWKMSKFKWIEAIGWVTMTIGFIALAYSILNFFSQESLFVSVFGSCFAIVGYLVATHYRKLRLES
jgi:hypothetical protein